METDSPTDIRLSVQRALLGNVPCSLRAVSVELRGNVIRMRCVFDQTASEQDKELLSAAGSEIISDYSDDYSLEEEFLIVPSNRPIERMTTLVYARYEP